jgi:hypothetical protein
MNLRNRIARLEHSRRVDDASTPLPLLLADTHEELVFILETSNLVLAIRREPDQAKKEALQRKLDEANKEYDRRWPNPWITRDIPPSKPGTILYTRAMIQESLRRKYSASDPHAAH